MATKNSTFCPIGRLRPYLDCKSGQSNGATGKRAGKEENSEERQLQLGNAGRRKEKKSHAPNEPMRIRPRGKTHSDTYNQPGFLHVASKLCVLGQETVTGMDHVDVVLESNVDDLVASQVGPDGGVLAPLANDIGLVGLLPVHAETVLIAVDGDGVQGEFVGGTEDADWDFTTVGDCSEWALLAGWLGSSTAGEHSPKSFFNCMIELLARRRWWTLFRCAGWSGSK
jgi:hypothetical protein